MKRLSISLPVIALALVLVLSGATPAPSAAAAPAAPSKDKSHFDIYYYWYTYPGDAFVDYESVSIEEVEYLYFCGWYVDTNPVGGTLISEGYLIDTYPHTTNPSVFLYRH